MELFGVGAWEVVAILLVMLVVAGPKRMIQWSYKLGQYVSVLRKMWTETAGMLQKELDDAGVDFKVPTEPPTRDALRKEVQRAMLPMTKPIQDSLDSVNKDLKDVKSATSLGSWSNLKTTTEAQPQTKEEHPAQNGQTDLGTWSQLGDKDASE